MKYQRICPKCNKIVYSNHKSVIDEAIKKGRLCFNCARVKYITDEEKKIASNNRRKKCINNKLGVFIRKCPGCDIDMQYNTIYELNRHNKKQTRCMSCAAKNKKFSEEHRKNLSIANTGKTHSEETRKKLSNANKGKKLSEEIKKKISDGNRGKTHTHEAIQKMRVSTLTRLEKTIGQISPRYNPEACKVIDEYGKLHGYNFQHAENGGEFYIKELGYWVDGYDKEKNVVIEYYEKHHDRQQDKDIQRQQEIVDFLKCKFIILRDGYDENSTHLR